MEPWAFLGRYLTELGLMGDDKLSDSGTSLYSWIGADYIQRKSTCTLIEVSTYKGHLFEIGQQFP